MTKQLSSIETQNVCGSSFWFSCWDWETSQLHEHATEVAIKSPLISAQQNTGFSGHKIVMNSDPEKARTTALKKIKIGEDTEDKVWFFMQWIWQTALITIFLHTHNDLGAATISGLMETADSILLFMLFLFHVTWKVPGEMYWWAQSYFQSSYKYFLENEISMMLFLWFLGAQIIMDKIFIGFIDLLSEIN